MKTKKAPPNIDTVSIYAGVWLLCLYPKVKGLKKDKPMQKMHIMLKFCLQIIVKTARNYTDFNLSAQFINNSGEVKSYQPILGFYANGELVNVKMENLVTLPAAENETVTINSKVITNELADNVDSIKLFV